MEQYLQSIAIVGIGCKLPCGIENKDSLWEALLAGSDFITEVPKDRWDYESYVELYHGQRGCTASKAGGFVHGLDHFDCAYFGIPREEAESMDPSQRMSLQASYHAIEDGGTPLSSLAGTNVGVFFGSFVTDHLGTLLGGSTRDTLNQSTATAVETSMIANRVSHRLDLRGPSMTVHTACSSGLVAFHLACQSIWNGESTAALAGGVAVMYRPEISIALSQGGFLGSSGTCKAFDAEGDGYVRSEGVITLYIKALKKALEDEDRVYAVVRGTMCNSDGFTPDGFSVPSTEAQIRLLQSVYSKTSIDPGCVDYVEAHGTGTRIGDPLEAAALGHVFGGNRSVDAPPLYVGSIKANIGHLEGAAGIAGVLRAALIAYHGIIPKQIHFNTPNPEINFNRLKIKVLKENYNIAEAKGEEPLVLGISSFGAGGTNSHVILQSLVSCHQAEEASAVPEQQIAKAKVLVLGANSQPALARVAERLLEHLQNHEASVDDIAHTLINRRTRQRTSVWIPFISRENLMSKLTDVKQQSMTKDMLVENYESGSRSATFVFSGQGGQWMGMGLELMHREPTFRSVLEDIDAAFQKHSGLSVMEELQRPEQTSKLDRVVVNGPAIMALQIALARTLESYGIKPATVVGHSIGEVAAAHIAGAITLEESVRVMHARSQVQMRLSGQGEMLAASLTAHEAQILINRSNATSEVDIAALNSTKQIVLSGRSSAIKKIKEQLDRRNVWNRRVRSAVPHHSQLMDCLKEDLLQRLGSAQGTEAECHLWSTVTAAKETGTHICAAYWFQNIRQPVRFSETVGNMMKNGSDILIEIGPHPVLTTNMQDLIKEHGFNARVFPVMIRHDEAGALARLVSACYHLHVSDADINSFNGKSGEFIDLPLYPFQEESIPFEANWLRELRNEKLHHPFDGGELVHAADNTRSMNLRFDTGAHPWLADHILDGKIVVPASSQIAAICLASKKLLSSPSLEITIKDLQFWNTVIPSTERQNDWDTVLDMNVQSHDYVISNRIKSVDGSQPWTKCNTGRVDLGTPLLDLPRAESLDQVRSRLHSGISMSSSGIYDGCAKTSLTFGESFKVLQEGRVIHGEGLFRVALPDANLGEVERYGIHPLLLEGVVQAGFVTAYIETAKLGAFVPQEIELVYFHEQQQRQLAQISQIEAHVRKAEFNERSSVTDIDIYTVDGDLICVVEGLHAVLVGDQLGTESTELSIAYTLVPLHCQEPVSISYSWITVFGDGSSAAKDILGPAFPQATVQHEQNSVFEHYLEARMRANELDDRHLLIYVLPQIDELQSLSAHVKALLAVAKRIPKRSYAPSIVFVTCQACPAGQNGFCNPAQAAIEVGARSIRVECPWIDLRVIDLPLETPSSIWEAFREELASASPHLDDVVVCLRSEGRYARRLTEATQMHLNDTSRKLAARGGHYRLEKSLETLGSTTLRQFADPQLGPNDVKLQVHAAGVNFKDIMNLHGRLSKRDLEGGRAKDCLGLDVAGQVSEVGACVHDLHQGDLVMGMAANTFAGSVVTSRDLLCRVPSKLNISEAAAVPCAYLTAYYTLVYLSRLKQRDAILVHSAAGGVGMAAIQIGRAFGARVLATASTSERRDAASGFGAHLVFDSRRPKEFHRYVMEATEGKGVDIVLNSLHGDGLTQSLQCLASGGTFIEIGKLPFKDDVQIGLGQFARNWSYHAFDLDRYCMEQPKLVQQALLSLHQLFETGLLSRPRITEVLITHADSAFKRMETGKVIGKIVLIVPEDEVVLAAPISRLLLRPDKSYLITGGASGLGLRLANFLIERGAKHLVLASRSGPKNKLDWALIKKMKDRGSTIYTPKVDVTDRNSVEALCYSRDWPEIAGILHSAAVMRDQLCEDIVIEDFSAVFAPKAVGAWNLHIASTTLDLDFFVLISSTVSIVSQRGLFSYAAASQSMDALAFMRQTAGLPALTLNFGLLGSYSTMSGEGNIGGVDILESEGLEKLSLETVCHCLEQALLQNTTQRVCINIDWTKFFGARELALRDGMFSALNIDLSGEKSKPLALNTIEQVMERLQQIVGKYVGIGSDDLSMSDSMQRFGLDSFSRARFRTCVTSDFRIPLTISELFQAASFRQLADDILHKLCFATEEYSRGPEKALDMSEPSIYGADSMYTTDLELVSPWQVKATGTVLGRRPRLIMLPHLGGTASFYFDYLKRPITGMNSVAIELPGFGMRFDEDPITSYRDVVDGITSAIQDSVTVQDILLGYSFGGLLAWDVVIELQKRRKPIPRLCIIAMCPPRLWETSYNSRLRMRRLRDYKTRPEDILSTVSFYESDEKVKIMVTLARTMAYMSESFQATDSTVLAHRIAAIAGDHDSTVFLDQVQDWENYAEHFTLKKIVNGDHWLIDQHPDIIRDVLEDLAAEQPSRH